MTKNIVRHVGEATQELRDSVLGGRGCTVLLTGLSGSGKSTIGFATEKRLLELGRASFVLDGDNLRFGLNSDLGFTPEDRGENVRRVAEVAHLMARAGIITLVPLIAPYAADRLMARQISEAGGVRFLEVFVDTPLEVCEVRDTKGLYRRARAGELSGMTGIDAPYERPSAPDLRIDTSETSEEEAALLLVSLTTSDRIQRK